MTTLQPMSSEQNDLEIQQQTALGSKLLSRSNQLCDDQKDADGAEDYDPTDSAEQAQAAKDAADDVANDDAKAGDSEAEFVPASVEVDEAELVNSEQFAEELQSAIDHVTEIAKTHRAEMLRAAKRQFERETGKAPTQKMVDDAMETMKESLVERAVESEAQSAHIDSLDSAEATEAEVGAVSAAEMESALEFVRELGRTHRIELEERFREQFSDVNDGAEPTAEEMSGIFARVREQFAEEARDEFLDIHDQEELEGDSDYEPSADQFTFEHFKDLEDDEPVESENISTELSDLRDDSLLSESEDEDWVEVSYQESEDTASTFDEAHFSNELDFALNHVRDLASAHQTEFVNSICDILTNLNGSEPSLTELYAAFSEIPTAFAHEANRNSVAYEINFDPNADEDVDEKLLANEMNIALEHVQNLAISHQSEFVNAICDIFAEENGTEPSAAELYSIFGAIKQEFADEAESAASVSKSEVESVADSDAASFDEEAFDEDMELALKHVRDLGALHQSEFVDTVCELYAEEYGAEPSTSQLYGLFSDIQQTFLEEADEEEEASESEQNSDYDPEQDSFDYTVDNEEVISSEVQIYAEPAAFDAVLSLSTLNKTELSINDLESALGHARELSSAHRLQELPSVSELEQILSDIDQGSEESVSEAETAESSYASVDESVSASAELSESEAVSEAESAVQFDDDVRDELDFALSHVRDLAISHRSEFVNKICDIISAETAQEPTTAELYGLFGSVKQQFAEEALEESESESESVEAESEYESVQESESESGQESEEDLSEQDSYDPDEDSFDYAVDAEDDIESEFQIDAESEIDSESVYESEAESADYSERDSYNPSEDSFDYAVDAEDSVAFASSASESASESEAESSVSASVSVSGSVLDEISAAVADSASEEQYDETDEESNEREQFEETESEAVSEAESVADYFDEAVSNELDAALDHVRELAVSHRVSFVNTVCDILAAHNGVEPTLDELYDSFRQIKQSFIGIETTESSECESEQETEESEDYDLSERDPYDPEEDSFQYSESEEESADESESERDSESQSESESEDEQSESVEAASESASVQGDFEYDLSERDPYDPKEDSFAYTLSVGDSESESNASIDSYRPSEDSFSYADDSNAADSVACDTSASESATEKDSESYDEASSNEDDE